MADKLTRVALVKEDKCKPKKCRQECKRSCPVLILSYYTSHPTLLIFIWLLSKVVKLGKMCIEVSPNSKLAFISEELCIGCGICIKKCPFEAINIINLPKSLASCQAIYYLIVIKLVDDFRFDRPIGLDPIHLNCTVCRCLDRGRC